MSLQRVDTDRTEEALALAVTARQGARDSPARVRAMLTVREARMHAVRGEAGRCEALLPAAESLMDRAAGEECPAWARYFDRAEYCAQIAACYLLLRRHAATDRWLTQTLALQPEERRRDRATYVLWSAESALQAGDLEQACALADRAIPDIATARSTRNLRRLADLHTRLLRHAGVPAVQILDEQIRPLLNPAA
jgi:hypothetical protein